MSLYIFHFWEPLDNFDLLPDLGCLVYLLVTCIQLGFTEFHYWFVSVLIIVSEYFTPDFSIDIGKPVKDVMNVLLLNSVAVAGCRRNVYEITTL